MYKKKNHLYIFFNLHKVLFMCVWPKLTSRNFLKNFPAKKRIFRQALRLVICVYLEPGHLKKVLELNYSLVCHYSRNGSINDLLSG